MMGSTDDDEGWLPPPGKSCLSGALAEMIMLYVINATESVITRLKKIFPQPILGIKCFSLLFLSLHQWSKDLYTWVWWVCT